MAHKVLIIEKTPKNDALVTPAGSAEAIRIFTNTQLLNMHNAALGKTTSKFANRTKAVQQTWAAISALAAVDIRTTPAVVYRVGDALPEEATTPAASGSSEAQTEKVIPASKPVGRPAKRVPARKLADGTYSFDMDPRAQKAKPGGRRPELVEMLRKAPTFRQLMNRYNPRGETEDEKAFNMATAMTCMGHVCGFGFRTDEKGRIQLLEPTSVVA